MPGPASLTLPKSFVTWNHEGGLLRIVSMLALVLQIVMCLGIARVPLPYHPVDLGSVELHRAGG